jgi:hypothetical protein
MLLHILAKIVKYLDVFLEYLKEIMVSNSRDNLLSLSPTLDGFRILIDKKIGIGVIGYVSEYYGNDSYFFINIDIRFYLIPQSWLFSNIICLFVIEYPVFSDLRN